MTNHRFFTLWIALALLAAGLAPLPDRIDALIRRPFQATRLNRTDENHLEVGYYDRMLDGPISSAAGQGPLQDLLSGQPRDWLSASEAGASELTGDFLMERLRPNVRMFFRGAEFTTNQLGLRNGAITVAKPPATVRVALVGSSISMGSSVPLAAIYPTLVERALNAAGAPRRRHYQIVNFSVGGYAPTQKLEVMRVRLADYRPDLIALELTSLDPHLLEMHLRELIRTGIDLKYDFIRETIRRSGARRDDRQRPMTRKISPYRWRLLDQTFAAMAETSGRLHAPILALVLPRVEVPVAEDRADIERIESLAIRHGFTVLDVTGAYAGRAPRAIEVAPWDHHPNAAGHRLLAAETIRQIHDREPVRRLLQLSASEPARRAAEPARGPGP